MAPTLHSASAAASLYLCPVYLQPHIASTVLCCLAGGRWLSLEQVTVTLLLLLECLYLSQVSVITRMLVLQVPHGSMEPPFL